jgi:hypothetical protein
MIQNSDTKWTYHGAADVMEMLLLCQGGVDGDNGADFPPAAATDQPFRWWKKGSPPLSSQKIMEKKSSVPFMLKQRRT